MLSVHQEIEWFWSHFRVIKLHIVALKKRVCVCVSGITLLNVSQFWTVVTGLAAFSPVTPSPSPDMKDNVVLQPMTHINLNQWLAESETVKHK